MRALIFAKRNFKEIIREPLSSVFCLAFPIVMLLIFQLIIGDMPEEVIAQNVPQFQINRLAPSIAVFSFSFLTLFSGMVICKDKTTSFINRLKISPMKSSDYIIGYTLPLIPMAFIQVIVTYAFSMIFGFKITGASLLSILTMIPIMLFFVALGLLLGVIFSDKAIGGVSSILINVAAIFSGMFMPLDTMNKTIRTIAYIFPFANSLKLTSSVITGNVSNILVPLLIVLAYTVATIVATIVIFNKKLNSDKI